MKAKTESQLLVRHPCHAWRFGLSCVSIMQCNLMMVLGGTPVISLGTLCYVSYSEEEPIKVLKQTTTRAASILTLVYGLGIIVFFVANTRCSFVPQGRILLSRLLYLPRSCFFSSEIWRHASRTAVHWASAAFLPLQLRLFGFLLASHATFPQKHENGAKESESGYSEACGYLLLGRMEESRAVRWILLQYVSRKYLAKSI